MSFFVSPKNIRRDSLVSQISVRSAILPGLGRLGGALLLASFLVTTSSLAGPSKLKGIPKARGLSGSLPGYDSLSLVLEAPGKDPEILFQGTPSSSGEVGKTRMRSASLSQEVGGRGENWDVLPLGEWLDQVLSQTSVETRSEVDLIFFEDVSGRRVALSRAFVRKYPAIGLGARKATDRIAVPGVGIRTWTPVFPWEQPRFVKEGISPGLYSKLVVKSVILANSKSQFSSWVLKRRTDPLAVRGEGVYLQTCVTCHSDRSEMGRGDGAAKSTQVLHQLIHATKGDAPSEEGRKSLVGKHSPVFSSKQGLSIEDRDFRSLVRYFDALHSERIQSGDENGAHQEIQQSSSKEGPGSSQILVSESERSTS